MGCGLIFARWKSLVADGVGVGVDVDNVFSRCKRVAGKIWKLRYSVLVGASLGTVISALRQKCEHNFPITANLLIHNHSSGYTTC